MRAPGAVTCPCSLKPGTAPPPPLLPPHSPCSLNPGVDRFAFSVVWELDPTGAVVSQWAGRSLICSCAKLTYPMVQQVRRGRVNGGGGGGEGAAKLTYPMVQQVCGHWRGGRGEAGGGAGGGGTAGGRGRH